MTQDLTGHGCPCQAKENLLVAQNCKLLWRNHMPENPVPGAVLTSLLQRTCLGQQLQLQSPLD